MGTTIGERIVEAYESAGLNRNQLAQALGTTYPNVIRWETGETKPRANYLAKIASVCGCQLEWLITGNGSRLDPRMVTIDDETRGIIDQVIVDLQQDDEVSNRVRAELEGMPWRGATRDTIWQYANDTVRRIMREERGRLLAPNHGGPVPDAISPRPGSMARKARPKKRGA